MAKRYRVERAEFYGWGWFRVSGPAKYVICPWYMMPFYWLMVRL